jgi:hypothetical protein
MNKAVWVGFGLLAVFVLSLVCLLAWYFGVVNTEVSLSKRYEAQFNVVETALDTMRKTIMNQHKCTKEWADTFIAVVSEQARGRTGLSAQVPSVDSKGSAAVAAVAAGGTAFQFGRESEALGIPPALFTQLANSIEGKLNEFKRAQDVLTDVWREHATFCQKLPNRWIVGDKTKPKPEMISSEITKDAIKTKKLDDDLMK